MNVQFQIFRLSEITQFEILRLSWKEQNDDQNVSPFSLKKSMTSQMDFEILIKHMKAQELLILRLLKWPLSEKSY